MEWLIGIHFDCVVYDAIEDPGVIYEDDEGFSRAVHVSFEEERAGDSFKLLAVVKELTFDATSIDL